MTVDDGRTMDDHDRWYLVYHVLLLLFPFVDLLQGRLTVLPPPTEDSSVGTQPGTTSMVLHIVKWNWVSLSILLLFYNTILTPLSIYTGLNLAFVLGMQNKVLPSSTMWNARKSPHFRVVFFFCYYISMTVTRIGYAVVDWLLRKAGWSPFSQSKILEQKLVHLLRKNK